MSLAWESFGMTEFYFFVYEEMTCLYAIDVDEQQLTTKREDTVEETAQIIKCFVYIIILTLRIQILSKF